MGAFCGIELFFPIRLDPVYATSANVMNVPTATPTPSPTPFYQLEKVIAKRGISGKQLEYANYIWSKWAPHGNRAQADAICTNLAEGHLDDSATGFNADSGTTDRGCWQFNDYYNAGVSDAVARNCIQATDIAYDKWLSRGMSYEGYWYGYGSNNYNLCMQGLQ